jgi:septum formation protein
MYLLQVSNMLLNTIKDIQVILGSQSPRRKELLASLDIDFDVVVKSIDESIPSSVPPAQAAEYIALQKLAVFKDYVTEDTLVITADTVVVDEDSNTLGKPAFPEEAVEVLQSLSGQTHTVYTGVALYYKGQSQSFTEKTRVHFAELHADEIDYYVKKYKPFDKAGAYGIQEWIGRIAVKSIEGSYENVMGLPTVRLYQEIKELIK